MLDLCHDQIPFTYFAVTSARSWHASLCRQLLKSEAFNKEQIQEALQVSHCQTVRILLAISIASSESPRRKTWKKQHYVGIAFLRPPASLRCSQGTSARALCLDASCVSKINIMTCWRSLSEPTTWRYVHFPCPNRCVPGSVIQAARNKSICQRRLTCAVAWVLHSVCNWVTASLWSSMITT